MTKEIEKETKEMAELGLRVGRSMVSLISAMAQRGAIKGEELFTIGSLQNDILALNQMNESMLSKLSKSETETKK